MKKSSPPNRHSIVRPPRLATTFTFLAVIALIFMSAITYAQWKQLRVQQVYSRVYVTHDPRTLAQVQRELLRFYSVIAMAGEEIDTESVVFHRNLVTSRFNILTKGLYMQEAQSSILPVADSLQNDWIALQPLIDEWITTGDRALYERIEAKLIQIEVEINTLGADEAHSLYGYVQDFGNAIRRNMISMLVGMAGFMLFLYVFFVGVIVSLRRSSSSQEALRSNERQLRATLNTIPDAVARITRDGVFTSYHPGNAVMLPNLSMKEGALVGRHIGEVLPFKLTERVSDAIVQALWEDAEQQFELSIPLPNQNEFDQQVFEIRIIPISEGEVQGMLRDVTAERQREETVYQSQKLESLGLLAGGIAHDFNNILAGIMGQASLAQTREKRGQSPSKHIDKVIIAAQRAADLTCKLLSYAGKGQFSVELFDVNKLIDDDRVLLETVSRQGVGLQFELAEYDIPIEADKGQIQQILLNLVMNAMDAVESRGGCVMVRAGVEAVYAADKRDLWSKEQPFVPGNYAFFDVEDNGSGMSAEVMSKIFDPFFTTKRAGHGLGLSGTLGIVHRHGGGVRVSSMEGKGSRFTILFPLAKETAAQAVYSTAMRSFVQHELGTILVVDDDAEVRELVTTILTDAGADVLVATDGREAVALFMKHKPEITLTILDMMMPEINGDEVYERIRRSGSIMPVLISSGYGDTAALDALITEPNVAFLPKPYHANELLIKIQQLIAESEITPKPTPPVSQADVLLKISKLHLPEQLHPTPAWV